MPPYSFDQQSVQRISRVVRFVESRIGKLTDLTNNGVSLDSSASTISPSIRGVLTTPLSRGSNSSIIPLSRSDFNSYFLYLSGFFLYPFEGKYKILGKSANGTIIWSTNWIELDAVNEDIETPIASVSGKEVSVVSFSNSAHYIYFSGTESLILQYQSPTGYAGIELIKTKDTPTGDSIDVFDPYLIPSDLVLPPGTMVICTAFMGEGYGVVQYIPRPFQIRTVEENPI